MSRELVLVEKLNQIQQHHKKQEKLKREKIETKVLIPMPHKFAQTLHDENGKLLFLDNIFLPGKVAQLGYCAHHTNGYFDCNLRCVPTSGKMLIMYCEKHLQEFKQEQKLKEAEIQEFLEKQRQELVQLLLNYKNS